MAQVEPELHDLVKRLIARRKKLGLSQADVVEKIGCADFLVAKWEVGMRRPTAFMLACWAQALGCQITVTVSKHPIKRERPLAPPVKPIQVSRTETQLEMFA